MTRPAPVTPPASEPLAELIVRLLTERRQTVAVAESLTGGLLAASLVEVPGASVVFRGGIVAYAPDLKSALLDVPAALLERYGAVHADVASAMAEGVRGGWMPRSGLRPRGSPGRIRPTGSRWAPCTSRHPGSSARYSGRCAWLAGGARSGTRLSCSRCS